MTYKQHYADFEQSLKDDLTQARKLDPTNFNIDVCKLEHKTYGTELSDLESIKEALTEQQECTRFDKGYIEITTELDYDVSGQGDGDYGIEIDSIDTALLTTAIRPMMDEEFKVKTDSDYYMKSLFKKYIAEAIYNHKVENSPKGTYVFRVWNIDCKLLSLYRDEILDFNGLVKATYSNC